MLIWESEEEKYSNKPSIQNRVQEFKKIYIIIVNLESIFFASLKIQNEQFYKKICRNIVHFNILLIIKIIIVG